MGEEIHTTDPAAIVTPFPIVQGPIIVAPPPIQTYCIGDDYRFKYIAKLYVHHLLSVGEWFVNEVSTILIAKIRITVIG